MDFRDLLASKYVLLDGATGSNLQAAGMPAGVCPEKWVLEHEDIFIDLQKRYIESGSDALYTMTFSCNRVKLSEYGLADKQDEMTKRLIELSRRAISASGVKRPIYILGDISMTGRQLAPVGDMPFDELVDIYAEEAGYMAKAGVDGFAIETMMSLNESRAALLAIKETTSLPVIVTLTYEDDARTLFGTAPETAISVLQAMGADAIGLNCSTGPEKMTDLVKSMKKYAKVPIIAKPNAGLPVLKDGVTTYDLDADTFAKQMDVLIDAGVSVVGGCCGTTPDHIKKLYDKLTSKKFTRDSDIENSTKTSVLTTERNVTELGLDKPFTIVGERINPTGKKALQEQLRQGSLDMVTDMAVAQVEGGAKVLDVNMGLNGINEKEMMENAVQKLTLTVDVPLCIDSGDPLVIENALRIYPGRALINSVSLEPGKADKLFPIAKKYGAMCILLPITEDGLPKDMTEKHKAIDKLVNLAYSYGLSDEDLIIDGLVATVGANKNAALEVLETLKYCSKDLGLLTICGLSNISFGLPERSFINTAFLTLAIGAGLTMAISNPSQTLLTNAALASDLLLAKDASDTAYIEGVVGLSVSEEKKGVGNVSSSTDDPLFYAVVKGREKDLDKLLSEAISSGDKAGNIIDEHLIPAINHVGELFEQKKYFLPQLISSAQTMEKAISILEPELEKDRGRKKLQTVIVATVKGDVHDIGKNLVVLMLKNYGYDVIDLGKDVETELIVETAREKNAAVIGLSALMTTTMTEMASVVDAVKKAGLDTKVIIGGACVTGDYADEIGADGYSEDATEAVALVNRLLGND